MELPPSNVVTPGRLIEAKKNKPKIEPYVVESGLFEQPKPKEKIAADIAPIGRIAEIPARRQADRDFDSAMTRAVTNNVGMVPATERKTRADQLAVTLDTVARRTGQKVTAKKKVGFLDLETMHPSDLVTWLDQVTNKDWRLYKEPDTILKDAQIANGGMSLSTSVHNKILACKAVTDTNAFFNYWHLFEKICVAFNNITPNFVFFDDLSPSQIGFAINEVDKIRESHPDYAMEIKLYVACKCIEESLILLPHPLSHFQDILDNMMVRKESKEDYINLKVDIESALNTEDLDSLLSKTDPVSIGVARFLRTKWLSDNGPQLEQEIDENIS